jgi:hypothetical protein
MAASCEEEVVVVFVTLEHDLDDGGFGLSTLSTVTRKMA